MDVFKGKLLNLLKCLESSGVFVRHSYWINTDMETIETENIDFSEHDRKLQEKIDELQSRISDIKSRCSIEAINDFKNGNYAAIKIVRSQDYEALKKLNYECYKENERLNKENEELKKKSEEIILSENDTIFRPSRYCEDRKYDPKDVIRDRGLNFNLGSAMKYLSRAGRKGDIIEDLQKAQQFIQFEIDYLSEESK